MEALQDSRRWIGTLLVLAAAFLSTGCLNQTPDQSGVFKSKDAGDSWQAIPDLRGEDGDRPDVFPPLQATAVGASPAKPDRVFAGTEDDLYLSNDAGKGWSLITDRLPDAGAVDVQDIAVLTSDPDVVAVAGVSNGYGKVFRSTDGGKSFRAVFTGADPQRAMSTVVFGQGRTLFAGDEDGNVFRSKDQGGAWQRVFSTESPVSALAVSGPHLFVGTFDRGVFHSADSGNSFENADEGLGDRSRTVWSLAVGGGSVYVGTQQGLFRSTDFGKNWRELNNPDMFRGALVQAVAVGGDTVYFASNAVMYRLSANGQGFIPRQLDLARSVTDIAAVSSGTVFVSASDKSLEGTGLFRDGLPVLQSGVAPGN
ncbi:MAG TPA: hypothetical protein VIF43_03425 [Patescibacteria group bacterium]|jgi:photosystem II stability/assembly factor-like uncharacterized protein